MKRPSITSPCVADRYARAGERIAEITFPDGTGALVSLDTRNGVNCVEVYRADPGVTVIGPSGTLTTPATRAKFKRARAQKAR